MNKAEYYDIIRYPVVTEKSTMVAEQRKYIFQVSVDATKAQITNAISHIFGVKVVSVNTILSKGKEKKYRGFIGKRNNVKKAIVTLESGQTIDLTEV